MKLVNPTLLLFALLFFACSEPKESRSSKRAQNIKIEEPKDESDSLYSALNDFREIETLIRNVYIWHDNRNPTDIGLIADSSDSAYIGYDINDLNQATQDLEESDFFTEEFIENYASIHLAVDKKLKKKEIEWLIGRYPNFGSGAEPWCNCQDVPYDEPNPWSELEVSTISQTSEKGSFYWKWGGIIKSTDAGWYAHKYHFKTEKVNGKWKVSYLEGLNLEDFTRKYN